MQHKKVVNFNCTNKSLICNLCIQKLSQLRRNFAIFFHLFVLCHISILSFCMLFFVFCHICNLSFCVCHIFIFSLSILSLLYFVFSNSGFHHNHSCITDKSDRQTLLPIDALSRRLKIYQILIAANSLFSNRLNQWMSTAL